MAYNNRKRLITAPVSIKDMQRAIGSSSQDLGTLCCADSINKFATFKPMPRGDVLTISRDGTAPFGLRTIYKRVNPWTGAVGSSTNTTLSDVVNALSAAITGGSTNPFLEDLTMRVKPTGGTSSAFRATDFVRTQSVRGTTQQSGVASVHGYKENAVVRYGYYSQTGVYSGINTGLKLDSDGNIVADEDYSLDQTKAEMFGSTYYNLDTRLAWGRDIDNSLCIIDWLDAMFSASTLSPLHHGILIWTTEATEEPAYIAVQTMPWSGSIGTYIRGNAALNWHAIEFLTATSVNTSSDFLKLSEWTHESNITDWMLIPGMIHINRNIANNDPYLVGAYFIRAEVYPYSNVFNLQMRVTRLGLNTSLKIFLSDQQNPSSPSDFLSGSTVYTASATGDHYIYGAANTGFPMHPSDYDPTDTSVTNRFNEIFTVGNTYYLCIWGMANQSESSARVIWRQSLVATSADSLEII